MIMRFEIITFWNESVVFDSEQELNRSTKIGVRSFSEMIYMVYIMDCYCYLTRPLYVMMMMMMICNDDDDDDVYNGLLLLLNATLICNDDDDDDDM